MAWGRARQKRAARRDHAHRMAVLTWRNAYWASLFVRVLVGLSNSYLHPDEHFQSLEVLTGRILGYHTHEPWEFSSAHPARSLGPLLLVYGPTLYAVRLLGLAATPLQIWYTVRLQLVAATWACTEFCVHRMLPTRPERIKALLFILTSWVTWVYQSHCFSNSVETLLVLSLVYIIDELRFQTGTKRQMQWHYLALGVLVAVGVFNRVTFVVFVAGPLWLVVRHWWRSAPAAKAAAAALAALGAVVPAAVFVAIDSAAAGAIVVAPWNNLLYNADTANLALHGLHPWYTHAVVNLPQLLGPGLLFLGVRNRYWRTTAFMAMASAVVLLSVAPHQELRFLVPIVPLACCCFDLELRAPRVVPAIMAAWYVYNVVMGMVMGVLHQGGVVPALDHLRPLPPLLALVWWRTYSPPTWILGSDTVEVVTSTEGTPFLPLAPLLVDTMGTSYLHVQTVVSQLERLGVDVYLVTPVASFATVVDRDRYARVWWYRYHLDMDHLDWGDWRTLTPGLGIYKLQR